MNVVVLGTAVVRDLLGHAAEHYGDEDLAEFLPPESPSEHLGLVAPLQRLGLLRADAATYTARGDLAWDTLYRLLEAGAELRVPPYPPPSPAA